MLEKLLALLCRFCHIVENLVVPAFPDCPAHKDNDFQGERLVNLVSEILQVLKGIQVSLWLELDQPLAIGCKLAINKEVGY